MYIVYHNSGNFCDDLINANIANCFSYRRPLTVVIYIYCDEKFCTFNFRTQLRVRKCFDDENFPNYGTFCCIILLMTQ